ncbi:MAG TPA: glycosyltransferase [Actinomycetota bacterium]|nr:glycosyltransferase [Actinomycetota bacterium]
MSLEALVRGFQLFVLAYFAALNALYAFFSYVGLRTVVVYSRELSEVALKDLLEQEVYKPVSILVPAHNEERSIVAAVRSFVSLRFPLFEVVVVSDGSTDRTVDVLIEAFALVEDPRIYAKVIPTRPVRRVLRSLRYPNLLVIDKENGGKADALNAALNAARYPLVAPVDSDSLLDPQAILRASRLFVEDDRVLAVGGTVRPLNGAVIREGRVAELRMPRRWVERLQIVEYARAFFLGRAGWTRFGALLIISGAFGLFRRDAVVRVGGFWTGTVGEDMEIVMRLHKESRRAGQPHVVAFTPDPICWTEVPSDLRTLRRQRNRWHRGLWTNLWRHRDMLLNPRYGRLGLLAVPYFWAFEGLGPIVEVAGYAMLVVSAATGTLNVSFASLFLALAVLYGVLLSQIGVGVEAFLLQRYPRLSDRLALLGAALLEFVGFRQVLALERFVATFRVGRREWGEMRRVGIEAPRGPAG